MNIILRYRFFSLLAGSLPPAAHFWQRTYLREKFRWRIIASPAAVAAIRINMKNPAIVSIVECLLSKALLPFQIH